MIDLDTLERLAREATQGPWSVDAKSKGELWIAGSLRVVPVCMVTASGNITDRDKADAAFIAASNPAVVLSLIERIRELEKKLTEASNG